MKKEIGLDIILFKILQKFKKGKTEKYLYAYFNASMPFISV